MSRQDFFNTIRPLFGGALTASQVQGMEYILDAAPADMPQEQVAYCFATAFHETGGKMQPVTENLNYSTAARIREVWPSRFPTDASAKPFVKNPVALANKVYGGRNGNIGANDGWTYRGRSLVQLTGRANYDRAGKKLLTDLVNKPELALDPSISARILFAGMAEGWFTGKKLSDYFGVGRSDPKGARAIINGTDEAAKIAGYHAKFLAALRAMGGAPKPVPPPDVPAIDPTPPVASSATPAAITAAAAGLVAAIVALLTALGFDASAIRAMFP